MADTPTQPGFGSLLLSGIGGYFKGGVIGAAVGAVGGALLGAAIALLAPEMLIPALSIGASVGAMSFGAIGSLAGGMTSVIAKSREGQMSAEAAANAVKIAYAQGVQVGKERSHEVEPEKETSQWRERYAREQVAKNSDVSQKIH